MDYQPEQMKIEYAPIGFIRTPFTKPKGMPIKPDGRILHIEDIDVLDNIPLLDIKPYVPDFDAVSRVRIGWLENRDKTDIRRKSDDRFNREEYPVY